jgi:HAE1 family hydrophobic/amphiphilic exporter-1
MTTHTQSNWNFASYIAGFFLNRVRITLLLFLLVIIAGTAATVTRKTAGFPNPSIDIILVQTSYPGASSQTVLEEVTQPLENQIKEIEGVQNFNSTTSNSFSNINLSLQTNADPSTVRSELDSAISSVSLPEEAQEPKIQEPSVSGPDIFFSLISPDRKTLFQTYQELTTEFSNLSELSSISTLTELEPKVKLTLKKDALEDENLTTRQVREALQQQIGAVDQTLPVTTTDIDNTQTSLVTTLPELSLSELRQLEINFTIQPSGPATQGPGTQQNPSQSAQPTTKNIPLENLAEINLDYFFVDSQGNILEDQQTYYAFNGNQNNVQTALIIQAKAVENTDQQKFVQKLKDIVADTDNVTYTDSSQIANQDDLNDGSYLIETRSVNESNQEQVNQVVTGLLGSGDGQFGLAGWLLGGLQLVALVMLIFVSWRAALLAVIGIPLSISFTSMYLALTGNQLNTLVLFSLVLVIGLVVDPALVILEAIKRKIDLGLSKKDAALAAVNDVGDGLLSSIITNLIVFLPFAVVSGTLGEIFSFIPLTIMPALVGSYIVAIVFLPWLGRLFLTKNKKSTNDEEQNLWPLAKWIISANTWILNRSKWLRTSFILILLIIPIVVTGFLFYSGRLKSVQFATSENAEFLSVSGEYLDKIPQGERSRITSQVLQTIVQNEAVQDVSPSQSGFNYFINLYEVDDRGKYSDQTSADVAQDLTDTLQSEYSDYFFDIRTRVVSNGPPEPSYQVDLAINSNDLETLESASLAIGEVARNQICQTETNQIQITDNCKGENIVAKVDDGYTNRGTQKIQITLDRAELFAQNLATPNGPLTGSVNQQLRNQFQPETRSEVNTLKINGVDTEILLQEDVNRPETLQDLKTTELTNNRGETIELSEVADIQTDTSKSSITRLDGQTVNRLRIRLTPGNDSQGKAAQVSQALVDYYQENNGQQAKELGLEADGVEVYSEGSAAEFTQTFQELIIALFLSIFLIYFVLVVFFGSFTLPLTILFSIPLTFLGAFPGLYFLVGSQFGFLGIIGLIILVGLVVNVAIYLIDLARQKINQDDWDPKHAIAVASGVRFRAVILTNLTAIASLAPLYFTSDFYQSIAAIIICGLTTSAVTSLFTTPVLFIFFRWLSDKFRNTNLIAQILFFPLFPLFILYWAIEDDKWFLKLLGFLKLKKLLNK